MKQVVVIGLGQFGSHLARGLSHLNCEVLAIDSSEEAVSAIQNDVQQAVICDARNFDAMNALVTSSIDEAVVSLGESMEPSIICTLHLSQIGVKNIRCKAVNEDHATILKAVGANEVIFPERETAERTARRVAFPTLLDYFPFAEDHRIMEIETPRPLIGKSLASSKLREEFNLLVLAIKNSSGEFRFMPGPHDVFRDGDTLIVLGREVNLVRLRVLE
ncbi:MAG: TrkA family potassium uptake protein [Phycisphaerae bacterium]|nr:TrkA family potassium uptake protein [Phycisphaerae bacterium]